MILQECQNALTRFGYSLPSESATSLGSHYRHWCHLSNQCCQTILLGSGHCLRISGRPIYRCRNSFYRWSNQFIFDFLTQGMVRLKFALFLFRLSSSHTLWCRNSNCNSFQLGSRTLILSHGSRPIVSWGLASTGPQVFGFFVRRLILECTLNVFWLRWFWSLNL